MLTTTSLDVPCDIWLEAAVPTFPCARDKRPVCKWRNQVDGDKTHPLNVDEARNLWKGLGLSAKSMMLGLDCEAVRIIVIDLDRNKSRQPAEDGVESFFALCEQNGIDLEGCLSVTTPSGGRHLYFADQAGRWRNTTGAIAPGVDTRGVGGFIITPGSNRGDGAYEPLQPDNLPDFIDAIAKGSLIAPPAALAALLDAKCASIKTTMNTASAPSPGPAVMPIVWPYLPAVQNVTSANAELSAGIPERWSLATAASEIAAARPGTRNDTMARVAFTAGLRVSALGLDQQLALNTLLEAAQHAGWGDEIKTRDTAQRQFNAGMASAAYDALASQVTGPMAQVLGLNPAQAAPVFQVATAVNSRSVLRATEQALSEFGILARRDLFRNVVVLSNTHTGKLPVAHEGALTDNACHWLAKALRERYPVAVTWNTVHEALIGDAEHNTFNPVTDWLKGLKWDGQSRLETWLPTATGAEPNALNRAAGTLIVQGMIMRARYPGSKFDLCVVLEGPQGSGKSSLAAALCDGPGAGYLCDAPSLLAMDGKERGEHLRGKWVVELAELAGLRRREMEEIKAFLSLTTDQYRPAYGRCTVEQQRTAIFIGTTNAREYLQDVTGNRRFVPIKCGRIDLAWFRQNRDQIFAEADARVLTLTTGALEGKPLPPNLAEKLEMPREHWDALAELTEDRREVSALELHLPEILGILEKEPAATDPKGGKYITAKKLLERLEALPSGRFNTSGLAVQMQRLGWKSGRVGKDRMRVYFAPPVAPTPASGQDACSAQEAFEE